MTDKELKVQDKKEVEAKGELTKAGAVFTPNVDIFENEDALILVADMPGVNKERVELHLEDNLLSVRGHVALQTPAEPLFTEYPTGNFVRTFTLSNIIDQSKIGASIKNGVLRVVLPKSDVSKPRKIAVKAAS